jgi:hypothetical protein
MSSICYPKIYYRFKNTDDKILRWGVGNRVTKFLHSLSSTFPPPNTFWLTNRNLGYVPCISKFPPFVKSTHFRFIFFSSLFRIEMEMSCYSLRVQLCKEVSATQTVGWQSNLGKSVNSSFLITIHAAATCMRTRNEYGRSHTSNTGIANETKKGTCVSKFDRQNDFLEQLVLRNYDTEVNFLSPRSIISTVSVNKILTCYPSTGVLMTWQI